MSVGAPDYRAYIASDEWRAKRAAALERSRANAPLTGFMRGPVCEVCGRLGTSYKNSRSSLDSKDRRYRVEYANGLQVHHVHYRNLGYETPDDLIVLCTDALHYGAYDFAYAMWHDNGRQGPPPALPRRVGCHERAHDDRAFRLEVARIARERG